ncbi:MAG: glycosyltransferase family 87 protein [Terriglobales bacterium]
MAEVESARPSRGGVGRLIVLSATALLLAAGMIYYYNGVLVPIRQRQAPLSNAPPGNWSDLYPRWLGARELLWHHRNPYSPEMTRDIQRGFYGRPLDASNRFDPKDPEAFAYPVYVVFLLAPLLPFPFDAVRPVFYAGLVLLTLASVPLWMGALNVRLRPWATVLASLATMSSFAVLDGLHLEQITLLVVFLLAASAAALARGRLALAGVLMALATVKPQLALLVVVFLGLWMLGDWRGRKGFALGFGGTMAALLLGSELVLPGWLQLWRQAAREYVSFHRPSLLVNLLGERITMVAAAVAIFLCLALFWNFRKEMPGSGRFNFALAAALTATTLLLPNAGRSYYNQSLLIPACLWLFVSGWTLSERNGLTRLLWRIAFTLLVGQWILAFPLLLAGLAFGYAPQRELMLVVIGPELFSYFFPCALALFVLSVWPQLRLHAKPAGSLASAEPEKNAFPTAH